MSGSKRRKQERNLKIRGILAGVMLAGCLACFIMAALSFRNGSTQGYLYGVAMVVLFFGTGMMAVPVVEYWQKQKELARAK